MSFCSVGVININDKTRSQPDKQRNKTRKEEERPQKHHHSFLLHGIGSINGKDDVAV